MESRLNTLESKVDKFSELFNEMITNQKLMHQEIVLLNKSMQEISTIKLLQVECKVNTEGRLMSLEDKCTLVNTKISFRDKLAIGSVIAILGYFFKLVIGV